MGRLLPLSQDGAFAMSSGMSPGNAALVVAVFGLLGGSAVSQRARTGLAWFGVPILCAFSLKRMHSGFDLVQELTFYSSYHADWRNQLVHVVFVPVLVFTAMIFLSYVPPLSRATPLGLPLNWATLAALAWSAHHCKCDPLVGLFTSLVTFGSALAATAIVQSELPPSPRAKPKSKGLPLARYGRAARWLGLGLTPTQTLTLTLTLAGTAGRRAGRARCTLSRGTCRSTRATPSSRGARPRHHTPTLSPATTLQP